MLPSFSRLLMFLIFLDAILLSDADAQTCEPEHLANFGGECYSVASQGNIVYLAEGKTLTILDFSNPSDLTLLSRFPLPFLAYDLAVDGTRSILAGGNSATECVTIDVGDPTAPELENTFNLPLPTFDVALSGDRACLAYGQSGVQLLDLSDPSHPFFGGSFNTPGQTYEVAFQGDLVYAADSFANTVILDASNPTMLSIEGTLILPEGDSPSHIAVDGNKLYLATYYPSLRVVDVSNPKLPQLEGTVPLSGFNKRGMAASGNKAVVTDLFPLQFAVVDVSVPATPIVSATYSLTSDPKEVALIGDIAAIVESPDDDNTDGDFLNGLAIFDLGTEKGAAPQPLPPYRTPYAPGFVKAIGGLLYVDDEATYFKHILHVMDISNPRLPATVGTHEIPEEPYEIQARGELLYVDVYTNGFQILDLSDPSAPALLNQINTPGLANDLELDGDRIYIADGDTGVTVYDAVNPVSPTLVGSWPDGPFEDYVDVIIPDGDLAYVSDGAGLKVLNVSDPSAISVVGSEPTFPRVFDMTLENGLIYGGLAGGTDGDGLQIADVSNPSDPVLRGLWPGFPSMSTTTLFKSGSRIFMGTFGEGLQIVDVSDPDAPVPCAGLRRPSEGVYVTLAGTYVYVSGRSEGIQVFGLGCQNTPDVNLDGSVDAKDLLLIIRAFRRPPTVPQPEDVNCDGILDQDDVLEFEQAWKTLTGNP